MEGLFPLFIILFSGMIFGSLFNQLHLPWVVALIIAGIIIGPSGLHIIELSEVLSVFAEIGLIFLMFMAGLETKLKDLKSFETQILPIGIINGAIPFVAGFLIGGVFDLSITVSTLIGIIFMSSSIAVVIPSLESNSILKTKLGQTIMGSAIFLDVLSLIILSIFLQTNQPQANLPLLIFYPVLFVSLIVLKKYFPTITKAFAQKTAAADQYQTDIRAIFLIMIGVVVIFELLGLHSIIAGFFTGFLLSDSLKSVHLKHKLKAMSYGVFIPVFFVIIGIRTDIHTFLDASATIPLTLAVVGSSVISKFASGFLGAKLVGYNKNQSLLFGISTVPQLSTTLAASVTALSYGIINQDIFTAMIVLSIITTLIGPTLMSLSIASVITKKDLGHSS